MKSMAETKEKNVGNDASVGGGVARLSPYPPI